MFGGRPLCPDYQKQNEQGDVDTLKKTDNYLEELYEYYRPKMDDIITADEILTGVKTKPDTELNFDQQFELILDIINELKPLYNGKYNVLVEAQINRFIAFVLDHIIFEIGLVAIKMILETIPFNDYPSRVKRFNELDKYFKFFT